MNLTVIFLLGGIVLIWNIVLTILFLKFFSYYQRLSKNTKGDSLLEILDNLSKKDKESDLLLEKLAGRCDKLEQEGSLHIQKVGLLRFNPFKDTGGDQSFILALVDGNDSGVVISSLHTRTGTRWYAKKVEKGKGLEYELSNEEAQALKGAKTVV